jgi:hypothetical protein
VPGETAPRQRAGESAAVAALAPGPPPSGQTPAPGPKIKRSFARRSGPVTTARADHHTTQASSATGGRCPELTPRLVPLPASSSPDRRPGPVIRPAAPAMASRASANPGTPILGMAR